jgi:hypothetical protein
MSADNSSKSADNSSKTAGYFFDMFSKLFTSGITGIFDSFGSFFTGKSEFFADLGKFLQESGLGTPDLQAFAANAETALGKAGKELAAKEEVVAARLEAERLAMRAQVVGGVQVAAADTGPKTPGATPAGTPAPAAISPPA